LPLTFLDSRTSFRSFFPWFYRTPPPITPNVLKGVRQLFFFLPSASRSTCAGCSDSDGRNSFPAARDCRDFLFLKTTQSPVSFFERTRIRCHPLEPGSDVEAKPLVRGRGGVESCRTRSKGWEFEGASTTEETFSASLRFIFLVGSLLRPPDGLIWGLFPRTTTEGRCGVFLRSAFWTSLSFYVGSVPVVHFSCAFPLSKR